MILTVCVPICARYVVAADEFSRAGVTTSTFIGANEIQIIQTSADSIDEVQSISTRASAVREVQTITATAPLGGVLAGTFSLAFDTRSTGGSLQYTGAISANAEPCCGRLSVHAILEATENIGLGGIDNVTRLEVAINGHVGYTWTVTFAASLSNVPSLQLLDASSLTLSSSVNIATLVEGNMISGSLLRLQTGVLSGLDIAAQAHSD